MNPPGLASTEAEQVEFFERFRETFATAASRTGEVVRDYRIAGIPVRLRFAGEAMLPAIVPGLAHVVEGPGPAPRCEFCIWDSASAAVAAVPRPRPVEDFTRRGNIWGFASPRYRTAYQWGEGSVSAMDRETGLGIYWVPSPDQLPAWALAAPLRTMLHWAMELNGRQLVHAAAVGMGDRGILIPGRSGSGKSSTALACLEHGLDFISDDYLALTLDPEPMAYRLFSTAKLNPAALAMYPAIVRSSRLLQAPDFDKTVLFLESARLRESLPIQQILTPRIADVPETTLGPIEPQEIEHALAGETLAHLAHVGSHTLDFLDRMLLEIPASAIHLGTDREGLVAAIRKALDTPPARTGVRRAPQPMISLVVYVHQEDRVGLQTLAAQVAAQSHRRVELIVVADGDGLKLPGEVHFHRLDRLPDKAAAWNRGIRESLGELMLFLEPGDRFAPGALADYAAASVREPAAVLIRSAVEFGPERPLAGAMIRKSVFREHGLFDSNEQEWLGRVAGLSTYVLDEPVFSAGPPPAPARVDLHTLKQQLDRKRTRP